MSISTSPRNYYNAFLAVAGGVGAVSTIAALVQGSFVYWLTAAGYVEKQKKRAAPAMKTCPDCANDVLAAARKCQHCGYMFQGLA